MKTIARLHVALLALVTLAAVAPPVHAQKPAAPAVPGSKPVFRQEGRNIADAPTLSSLKNGGRLQGNWVAETDSFPLLLNGFQDLAGNCAPRGWVGQDRTDLVFAHISDKAVTNRPLYAGLDPLLAPPATLPAPNDRYALDNAYGVALDDSGAVIISAGNGGPRLFAAYPGAGVIREFGGIGTSITSSPPIAFDPLTGGVFAVYSGRLWLTPADGGGPVALNPEIGSSEDTTLAAFSFTDLTQMATDPAGNLYWTERGENRVRVLRRNDLRVVTVVGTGLSADNGVGIPARSYNLYSPSGLALTPDGNTLYVADGGHARLIRVQDPLDPDAIVELDDTIGFNEEGWPNYLALSGDKLYMGLGYGTLGVRPLAGGPFTDALGRGALYATPAQAYAGGAHTIGQVSSIVADGAGGIYMGDAVRKLVIHYTAAGQVELVAGYVNPILMGTRALRVGADMESHPAEVANWVRPQGFGNDWSQRVISPPIPVASLLAGAVLTFDITVELEANALAEFVQFPFDGQFIAVQCEMPDGTWRYLIQRVLDTTGGWTDIDAFTGQGTWRVQVPFDATLGNSGILPASGNTRLRIVVQSNPLNSSEDGFVPGGTLEPRAAAVLDNIALRVGASDVIAFTDFEDGSMGPWTTAAYNAYHAPPGVQQFYSRDGAPTANIVQTQKDFDAADPSCVWTFTDAAGLVPLNTLARLTSPWIPLADATKEAALAFSGKLPLRGQARVLNVWVRGKNSGDARPAFASPSNFFFFYIPPPDLVTGIVPTDGDYLSPFFKDRVVRFPTDFQFPNQADSVQFVFQVEGRFEQFISQNFGVSGGPTALPFLDDLKVYQSGVDQDFDGVADAVDACPTEPGAGQDGDGDGCPSPTATLHNAESWSEASLPLALRYSQGGLPGAADAFAELDAALAAWTSVPGALVPVTRGADTPQVAASPMDGVNLVTFADDSYPFAPEVLGVTPTLSALQRTSYNDRIVLPGEIVDADVIFNPRASFRTPARAGTWDLRSVATHELGHLLGLSHSGVSDATMFFVQQPGEEAASLTQDDRAAIAATYPDPVTFGQGVGSIKGTVTRGGTGEPVAGALVTAVALDGGGAPQDTVVSDYTDERGRYSLYQLPPGDYGVHIQALDGQVLNGLVPDYISLRLKEIAGTSFDAEWHSDPETDRDDPALRLPLAVAAGAALSGIDITTNADTIPPTIVSVDPVDGGTDAAIDAAVQVTFSEAIDGGTLASSFGVYPEGSISRLEGNGYLSGDGLRFVFTPSATFAFDTPHTVRFTTALKDRRGTAVEAEFNSTFTTQAQPPVAITALSPGTVVAGTQVTITGSGFDPTPGALNLVALFPIGFGLIDTLVAGFVTPTSLVVQIPPGTAPVAFEVRVVVNELTNVSNTLTLNIVLPPAQASPTASGSAVPVGFALNDVAVTDAGAVFAAGDGGLAYIGPAASSATTVSSEPTQSVALTPDGRLLVASQPDRGRLQVFDADPSGTPGTLLATIPVDGAPFGVAISPTGQRAYATDEDTTVVHEIDLRAGSATRFTVVGVRALPPGAIGPNGGIAVDPRNDRYYLTTSTGTWSLATDGGASLLTSAVGTGVTPTPSGAQVIVPTPSAGLQLSPAAAVATGGSPRDVVVTPLGQSGLVANSVLNQLQVVDLTPLSPTYLKVVGTTPTGDTPVAVSINNRGDIVAVANRASRTVSRYTLNSGTTPALQRVVGDVAMPGEIVGLQGDEASGYLAGTQVDLGGTFVAPTGFGGSGSALAARIPALPQRQTSLAVQRPDGTRSLSLPFTVVEPVVNAASRPATSIALPDTSNFGEPATYGQVRFARVSPDGRRLAVMQMPEIYQMSLFAIGDDEPAHGRYLGSVQAGGSAGDATWDAAFTPDGRALWINSDSQFFRVIDADPASGTFGQILGQVPSSSAAAVVTDPLGRYVITTNRLDNTIPLQIWTPTASAQVAELPINADGLAVSPDGRLVLAQADFQMHFVQLEPPQLLETYTKPGSTGDAYEAVAVTRDGRYGFAIGNPRVGAPATFFTVWNLDPQSGPVGQVVYSKTASEASPLDGRRWLEAWPGPTTSSILLGAADGTVWIVGLQPSGSPVVTLSLTGIPDVKGLAVTPGARRLYLPAGGRFTSTPGRVEVLNLTDATRADLVSGDGQTGLAGAVLPSPVRMRVTDGAGRPQYGVLVRFEPGTNGGAIVGSEGLAAVEQVTDANGEAEVSWQLPAAGPTLLTSATMDVRVLGVSGQPVLVATATIVQDDSQVAPVVLQLSPADGATGLNATTPVAVRFNQKMAPAVTGVIELRVNDTPVQGAFTLEDEGRLVLFQPFAPLPFGATCRLVVTGGNVATDTDGQPLADGATASFTVQAAPAVDVTTITPPSGPVGASVVIGGTAFSTTPGGNAVLFNGASAVVSDATGSAITASVPLSATSGPVQVVVGSTTAAGPDFVVLPANPVPGGAAGDLQDVDGIREMAVTPDGSRGYVTNPTTNTVTALDLLGATTLTRITVGLRPQGVAILPEPQRAYVANTGSNNLSVIDIDPASPTYHAVVKSIAVEEGPIDVVVSPVGPRVYVLNQTAGSLSVIDANAGNATYDQVVTTVKTGSGGQNVAVSPDGSVAYIAAAEGLIVVDLQTNAVVTTVKTGSGGQNVAVTPDGTIVLLLLTNGDLLAISIAPGASQYQVVTTVKTGSGGQTVAVSPDGSLAYVTDGDGDQVLVFELVKGTSADASTFLPVPSFSFRRVATIPTGQAPAGIAFDPTGSGQTFVVNSGAGTVTVLGRPIGQSLAVAVSFDTNVMDPKDYRRRVAAFLEPPAGSDPAAIDIGGLRLNGDALPDLSIPPAIDDFDGDGQPELRVYFQRLSAWAGLPDGDSVPVDIRGLLDGRPFRAGTSALVRNFHVIWPAPGVVLAAASKVEIRWHPPANLAGKVAILLSDDRGESWTEIAYDEQNDGSYDWGVPPGDADSLLVAVMLIYQTPVPPSRIPPDGYPEQVLGVIAESGYFSLRSLTDAEPAPAELAFAAPRPNPARGVARLRFGLPGRMEVSLVIYDVQGRAVRVVARGEHPPGWHLATWRGESDAGGRVGPGLYFARFRAGGRELQQRIVMLR